MAYKKIKNNNYVADTAADLKKIRERDMNASCYVIDEACEYRLKSTGEWVKQVTTTVSSGSGDVDLSNYATKSFVEEAIATIKHPVVNLDDYAKTADVDSAVSGLKADMVSKTDLEASGNQSVATAKVYTNTKIAEVEGKIPDVSGFATKEEIPSLDGYAMTVEVEAIKANPMLKAFDFTRNPSGTDGQAIFLTSEDTKTLREILQEKGIGVYNIWLAKTRSDLPQDMLDNNTSGRGFACVDFQLKSNPNDFIGYAVLFDKLSNMYFQFFSHGESLGWKKVLTETN